MIRETLLDLFTINHQALHTNLKGLTDADALVQPKPDGNCLAWVVGHIVASRDGALTLVGADSFLDPETRKRYARGSAPVREAGDGKPLTALLADLDRSQERLTTWLTSAPDSVWTSPLEGWGTVAKGLLFLHFHEAYHVGQTGILRRLAGKKGAIA